MSTTDEANLLMKQKCPADITLIVNIMSVEDVPKIDGRKRLSYLYKSHWKASSIELEEGSPDKLLTIHSRI